MERVVSAASPWIQRAQDMLPARVDLSPWPARKGADQGTQIDAVATTLLLLSTMDRFSELV